MSIDLLDAKVPKNERVYAVGDVHGCLAELDQLLAMIKDDLKEHPVKSHHIIFLGDYVDRGPDSAGVINRLIALQKTQTNVVCLKGNHEDKFIEYLNNPKKLAPAFFAYGGIETAQSYGINTKLLEEPLENAMIIGMQILDVITNAHMEFLIKLPSSNSIGDYFFCHAGIRPGVKLKDQSSHDLMWIRQDFLYHPNLHKKIIVHGHTPNFEPEVMSNRINVDTKCYDSGVLSCLVLQKKTHRFLQTGG
jgi:serine/threonine protein phosphatase 1